MAITETAARLFIRARLAGVDFDRTLVVGRQVLGVSPLQLWRLLRAAGLIDVGVSDWLSASGEWPSYAEPFFRGLGARELKSLDNSDYEQADVIHDLNRPIPDVLHGRFDLVVDGGSIEHVFDLPQALRNLMNMVAVGGHLILMVAANDMCGHGFYQLSPELFFRTLRCSTSPSRSSLECSVRWDGSCRSVTAGPSGSPTATPGLRRST